VWCIRRGIGGGSPGDGAVLYIPDLCLRPVLSVDRGDELALDGFATFHVVNPTTMESASTNTSTGSSRPATASCAFRPTTHGYHSSRPPCVHCLTGSGSCRCCLFWTSSDDPIRRSQDLSFQRSGSDLQFRTRKSAPRKTFRL